MSSNRFARLAALAVSAILAWSLPAQGQVKMPRGLFALSSGTQPFPESIFTEDALEGISLRAGWSEIEAEEGAFTWVFDSEIERAKRAGKTVMLRVTPGRRTPKWVYDARAEKFAFIDANPYRRTKGAELVIPVPWDPVFLNKWTRFIKEMGERYAKRDTVVLIHMAGPAEASNEMHLPKTERDKKHWSQIGYSKSKLVRAWETVIDAYAAAFPTTHLALNVALPIYDDGVVEGVLAYAQKAIGKRFCVQHNGLAAKTKGHWSQHRWVTSYKGPGIIGFQLLTPVTPQGRFNDEGRRFGGPMEDALRIGLDAGAVYFEIYPVDLKDEPSARAIRDSSKRMKASGR